MSACRRSASGRRLSRSRRRTASNGSPQRIIYEDARILVLDKPAGLAVHGGSSVSLGCIEALRLLRPESKDLELAHRLDRDTSGCLLLAKRRSALRAGARVAARRAASTSAISRS